MIEPRPYQKEAVKAVLEARKRGVTRQLEVLPTGAGKTLVFGMLAREMDVPTIVLAHREELLNQARTKIRMVWPEADVGILQAERMDGLTSRVCVASVQTAATERRMRALKDRDFKLMVVDECFPAGTLVDDMPIEAIDVGDEVFSFDHKEQTLEKRKVVRVFKQPMRPLVKVTLSDGTHLVCTEEHPIFVYERSEYVACRNIGAGDHVVHMSPVRKENRNLFEFLRVDRIEVFEQGDRGENFGNDFVYNLEVEGNNNYFADGILVHNCHHATAESYYRLMSELGFMSGDPEKLLVGVTATGYRGDGVGLSAVFEEVVYERSITTMIRAGYLCDARGISVSTKSDLSSVHTRAGDFALNELSDIINIPARNELVAKGYLEHAKGRKAVVFCCDVKHSRDMADAFRSEGIGAEAVYGDMDRDDRSRILSEFDSGPLNVVTNCNVLTEGWDAPNTSAIMLARPTKSAVLYTQMVGRGLRTAPMKQDCVVIDFVDTAGRHKLCNLATLAGDPRIVPKNGETLGEAYDRVEHEEQQIDRSTKLHAVSAEFDLFERSKFVWAAIGEHFRLAIGDGSFVFAKKSSDGYVPLVFHPEGETTPLSEEPIPLGYAMGVCEDYCRQYGRSSLSKKAAPWRKNRATEKQIDFLRRAGIEYDPDITAGEASKLIDQRLGEPATEKQKWFLRKNGVAAPELLTKMQASKLIREFKESLVAV
jgi:superfamily II DNA or RNA helicase